MNNRFYIILGALVVLFVGLVAYGKLAGPEEVTSNGSTNTYGKLDSKVTLTEFVDFQCEACYGFYPTVKEIKEKYKDRVKFEVKYFPIATSHKFARMAAANAEAAAQQGKFWQMHDRIFEGQKVWEQAQNPQQRFDQYAQEIGLDMDKLKSDIVDPKTTATINADLAEVKRLGGDGTPTFALNGEKITNPANSVEAISKVHDEALKTAN